MGPLIAHYLLPLLAAVGLGTPSVGTVAHVMAAGALISGTTLAIAWVAHTRWRRT